MITSSASTSATSTTPRIVRLRFLAVKLSLRGRQDEQQPAIVVIRREDVGLCSLGPVSLRMNGDRLVQDAYSPLECCADVIVPRLELEPQDLLHRTPDHIVVAEARQLACAAAGPKQAALLVAREEGGVRRRVVVVQQLEHEAGATLVAAARAVPE